MTPVPVLRAVTVAPDTGAPDSSSTLPCTIAVVTSARAGADDRAPRTTSVATERDSLIVGLLRASPEGQGSAVKCNSRCVI
jgi:hypothetical protein